MNRTCSIRRSRAGAIALFAMPLAGMAQVYNVADDWSDKTNPSGAWSYRAGDVALPHVDAWMLSEYSGPQPGWATGNQFGEAFLPFWNKSVGSEAFTHDWIAGDVVVHTHDPANGGANGLATLVWTSPVRGSVSIEGAVWMGREIGRGNTWTILHNDLTLTGGAISSGDSFDREEPYFFGAGSGGPGPLAGRTVAFGDEIALRLERTGPSGDFVGVNMLVRVCVGLRSEPADARACDTFGNAEFAVEAEGEGKLTYRWRLNGVDVPISGPLGNPTAHSPTLVVPFEFETQGSYDCVVTSECGTITSNPARLLICIADFNCDDVANSTDVSDFINQWFIDLAKGTLITDIDGNGVVNSTDVSEFINRWFEDQSRGCG